MKNFISKASLALTVLLTAGPVGAATITVPSELSRTDLGTVINTAMNVFIGVVGLLAIIYLIVGGLSYIMSAGNTEKITTAKNTVIYAILGLVIAAAALSIKAYVLNRLGLALPDKI